MSDNELTPSEIEALTNGLSEANRTQTPSSAAKNPVISNGTTNALAQPLAALDPHQVGWDAQLQCVFRRIIDCFAADAAAELEEPIRASVSIEVESIHEVSYGELALQLDNPTCLQLLEVTPFDSLFVLELHPTILFPIFDRLLGGGQLPAQIVRRPLTEIESRLTGRITRILAEQMRVAWQPMMDVEVRSTSLACNPRTLHSEKPQETMVVTCFDMAFADCRGPVRLAVRRRALVDMRDRLLAPPVPHKTPTSSQLSVTVGQLKLSQRRLESLQVGDVLMCKTQVNEPAQVIVDAQPRSQARLGSFEGKKAIEITAGLDNPTS